MSAPGKGKGSGRKGKRKRPDPAAEAFAAGVRLVRAQPALNAMFTQVCREHDCAASPGDGLVRVDSLGTLHAHPTRLAEPAAWAWALAHALIHLGFGHVPNDRAVRPQPDRFDLAARCAVVNRFLATVTALAGHPPDGLPTTYPNGDEEQLAARWRRDGVPPAYERLGTAGGEPDQLLVPWRGFGQPTDWQLAFAHALTRTVSEAMDEAGGRGPGPGGRRTQRPWDRALGWFVSSYPLLGGVAAGMKLVADAELTRAHGITTAAVSAEAGEIYVNPLRVHTDEEWRFVLAHEMLHAALRHADRRGGRDPYLFNVACDYVINGWLTQMHVGDPPPGLLYDPQLAGLSAEEVYDRIATDLRRLRRLATLAGRGACDVLDSPLRAPGAAGESDYADLDAFYRRGLAQGLEMHGRGAARGLLPAGLVQEIRALSHPPLPWDARLARWFDAFVPRPLPVRSYARPSRRQASTPGIPRAGRYFPPEEVPRCTFGVVLDTSASMGAVLLGKALGAIASYATARDVPAARVVYCDAAPHDAGYLPATEIATRARVHGRGGTALQPGIDLLHRADDFPPDAPVLVITDGECDVLRIRRDHAYLLPRGARLPFTPRGPVFSVR